jgi:hypothetical protein
MGAESQTGDKVWGRVFTVILAQEGGGWVRTFVVLQDRGAAQLTVPANINLNQRLIFRRSKKT